MLKSNILILRQLFNFFRETIKYELANNKPLVDRLLSDITYQSADNLVDGLTKANEEGYTYEHYYGNKKHQHFGSDYQYVTGH
jgi:hypothetical protein